MSGASGELFAHREAELIRVLRSSPLFATIFARAGELRLPNSYIAGGCITQTLWNAQLGLPPLHGLKDVDIVYFDEDRSAAKEAAHGARIRELFSDLPIPVDVVNEARIHEWYPKKFGDVIEPYLSAEDGISTWLPTFAIGVRPEGEGVRVFAPFGLEDAFAQTVRPNQRQVTEPIYARMVARLLRDWPGLRIVEWDSPASP